MRTKNPQKPITILIILIIGIIVMGVVNWILSYPY
jgi:hypothetical protein